MAGKLRRMQRRKRARASRSTQREAHLVQIRLELEVLQPLLDERDEGAGGKLRALRYGRLRDVRFVAEGVRRVREATLLQVAVDEVVDLVGGDGHPCRGPDGSEVPRRRAFDASPGAPRGN